MMCFWNSNPKNVYLCLLMFTYEYLLNEIHYSYSHLRKISKNYVRKRLLFKKNNNNLVFNINASNVIDNTRVKQ